MEPASHTQPSPPPTEPALSLSDDLTGQRMGDFQILRRLGQGGMGQVYLAEQVSLRRQVALKMLRPELAANPVALKRFQQEAESAARATHANIVQVYMIGAFGGLHYMALEFIDGRSLKDFLQRKGPPDLLLALSIMRQVAAALQRAGEMGIIHRDIKPENILLSRKGEAKVADFGLSRCLEVERQPLNLTQSGITMGTPLYMSPEQVEGKQLDCRTDMYSFGVTCYHMLAGQPPFQGTSAFEVALQHVRREPAPLASIRPDLPEPLCAIVHRMMAKDPSQRYQTGRELLKDLVRLRESLTGTTSFQLSPLTATNTALPATPTMPAAEAELGLPAETVSAGIPAPRRRSWLPLLFLVSVLLAGTAGVVLALLHQPHETIPAPTGHSGDGSINVDGMPAYHTKEALNHLEEALRTSVDGYLDPKKGFPNVSSGVALSLDLGLLYLDHQRLDDAERFFKRLDGLGPIRPYHALGCLGRAIVLALKNQAVDSNKLFRETVPLLAASMRDTPKGKRPEPEMQQILTDPRLRHWISEALYYNNKNGILDKEVPPRILLMRELPRTPKE